MSGAVKVIEKIDLGVKKKSISKRSWAVSLDLCYRKEVCYMYVCVCTIISPCRCCLVAKSCSTLL